ncbi:MAG TPA: alpha/beta hydrolase [Streptosporangiaceae bacterium]|nr:alpha/beta hydrolase [Streptosporangiaceae bacterium]
MIGARPGTSDAPWQFAEQWGARGYVTELSGLVHWVEFGAKAEGPPIVFVHGLGGSHLNWCLVGPHLAAGWRAVALDLRGFGLTPGTRGTATVAANVALLDRFVREVTGTPVVLVGNSLGGLVCLLQAARAPETVTGLVLVNPALPPSWQASDVQVASMFMLYALPGLGELSLRAMQSRRPPELAVADLINLCFADPSRADPDMTAAATALAYQRLAVPRRDESFLAASRSLLRMLGSRQRYWANASAVQAPVLLIGGDADRLVPVASIHQAGARYPDWETVVLPGVGHTPQLEVPAVVVDTLRDWLARRGERN